jgi:hypothetical protein
VTRALASELSCVSVWGTIAAKAAYITFLQVEAVAKIIVIGLLFNGRGSYLRRCGTSRVHQATKHHVSQSTMYPKPLTVVDC